MIINLNSSPSSILNSSRKTNNSAPSNIIEKLRPEKMLNYDSSAISQDMRGKMKELDWAVKYAQEGVTIAQIAQEGLEKIDNNLKRMKELVTMATGEDLTEGDRKLIQEEINQLNKSITEIAEGTNYKGENILATDDEDIQDVAGITQSSDEDIIKSILGNKIKRSSVTAEALGTDKIDVSTAESAAKGLEIVDQAIKKVKDELLKYKSYEMQFANSFEFTVQNSDSDIEDYNNKLAADMLELIKHKISNEKVVSFLSAASQNPDNVLTLLTDK